MWASPRPLHHTSCHPEQSEGPAVSPHHHHTVCPILTLSNAKEKGDTTNPNTLVVPTGAQEEICRLSEASSMSAPGNAS
jgi:hypothetical protein